MTVLFGLCVFALLFLPFQGAKDGRLFNVQNFLQRAAKPASGEGGRP